MPRNCEKTTALSPGASARRCSMRASSLLLGKKLSSRLALNLFSLGRGSTSSLVSFFLQAEQIPHSSICLTAHTLQKICRQDVTMGSSTSPRQMRQF